MPEQRSARLASAGHPHPVMEEIALAILATLEEIRDGQASRQFKANALADAADYIASLIEERDALKATLRKGDAPK